MITKTLPEYPDYIFRDDGNVYSKLTGRILAVKQRGHYVPLALSNRETGRIDRISRHRVIAMAFHGRPIPPRNVVNHKNEVPGDDRPDNLEWVTHKQNLKHSTDSWGDGVRKISVEVRNVLTGEVQCFESVKEASKSLSISRDAVLFRIRQSPSRVYPDGLQYRAGNSTSDWATPEDSQFGNVYSVLVKDVTTGEVKSFHSQRAAGEYLGFKDTAICNWVNGNQPLIKYKYLVKRSDDDTPWREIGDPLKEKGLKRPVIAYRVSTGEVFIYPSCRACAKDLGILVTTLSERLHSGNPEKVWKDGFRYMYYD